MDVNEDVLYLQCECVANSDHMIRITVDDGIYAGQQYHEPQFIVSACMRHYKGFWGRLGVALKYVLGIDNTYCHYMETICSFEQMEQVTAFVNKYKDSVQWISVTDSLPKEGQMIEGKSEADKVWLDKYDSQEPLGAMTHWRPFFGKVDLYGRGDPT